ncbi:hypothetical protein HMPREF3229_00700 [Peptoniphilus harei]|uniref:Uncharacterized protein n=1 Tax=Peptoniphilus harei TaxID=54005 RepID=A0A133PQJ8_9FIRM|nr:hypothetical protein HMPREF3229_00700 [Peptoniphilus harei]
MIRLLNIFKNHIIFLLFMRKKYFYGISFLPRKDIKAKGIIESLHRNNKKWSSQS